MKRTAPMGLLLSLILMIDVAAQETKSEKIVIAHRGASGYLPEHTLEAYALAYGQGADYIEPDLVMTKDGVLICLHDVHLELTTNVEEKFPNRKRTDGHWYSVDFTLSEIKSLHVHERTANRFPRGKAQFDLPTFEEMIELVQGLNRTSGREVGIYPELKAPAWHRSEGFEMEERFLEVIRKYGYTDKTAKIFIQCFEVEPLQRLRTTLGSQTPQVLLLGGRESAQFLTDEGLAKIREFAEGIGPSKNLIESDPGIVRRAHEHGLLVHPYTLRADDLPPRYDSFEAEIKNFYNDYDVDGVFTDFPDRAVVWLQNYRMNVIK